MVHFAVNDFNIVKITLWRLRYLLIFIVFSYRARKLFNSCSQGSLCLANVYKITILAFDFINYFLIYNSWFHTTFGWYILASYFPHLVSILIHLSPINGPHVTFSISYSKFFSFSRERDTSNVMVEHFAKRTVCQNEFCEMLFCQNSTHIYPHCVSTFFKRKRLKRNHHGLTLDSIKEAQRPIWYPWRRTKMVWIILTK
jgi:hypothetical protein